jgi:hypothetical protein
MKFSIFENIMVTLRKSNQQSHDLNSLGIDVTQVTDPLHQVISHLLGSHYGQEGLDWIDWFMYDKEFGKREDIKAYDKEKNEICKNLYELWEIVEDVAKENPEYDLKTPMTEEERKAILEAFYRSF